MSLGWPQADLENYYYYCMFRPSVRREFSLGLARVEDLVFGLQA